MPILLFVIVVLSHVSETEITSVLVDIAKSQPALQSTSWTVQYSHISPPASFITWWKFMCNSTINYVKHIIHANCFSQAWQPKTVTRS